MYSADATGSKYADLDQINQDNVEDLMLAWSFKTGGDTKRSTIECNPLIADGIVYITSPDLQLIALDAVKGTELWRFDQGARNRSSGVNRGVTYWQEGIDKRIFFVRGYQLFCINANDGTLIPSFGNDGTIDLRKNLGRNVDHTWVTAATPGMIYQDLIIMGTTLGEGPGAAAPGHIRAYNIHTGNLEWIFHTIPFPGEPGYETWSEDSWTWAGGANAWGGFTLDEDKGIVYCGTGSSTYDHYGGNRLGMNLYANCILALNAATGELYWHFQTVHHDIWDYDLPCPPNLVRIKSDTGWIDALAQPTKMGHLFVLDRETGAPVYPIQELPVPQSDLPTEKTSPTQPFPLKSLVYADQIFNHDNASTLTDTGHEVILNKLDSMKTGGIFTPPGLQPSVVLPQFNGGTDWGGAAYDPSSNMLYVNASNEAEWISMIPRLSTRGISVFQHGRVLFQSHCAVCHSLGSSQDDVDKPTFASLRNLVKTISVDTLEQHIRAGKGQMPSFRHLSDIELKALSSFLKDRGHNETVTDTIEKELTDNIPYVSTGHNEFRDPDGYPVNERPWGTLNAINLDEGGVEWQVPLGTYPALEEQGLPPTGTFNMGGPVVTSGGLVFIGATMDERFRAFSAETGEVLWEYQLNAGAYATPSVYMVDGVQYVIIAGGGGGKPGTKSDDTYYCFRLP